MITAFILLLLSFSSYAQAPWTNYKKSNFNPYMNIKRCSGGGITYRSPYISVVHLYENFLDQNKKCQKLNKKSSHSIKENRLNIFKKSKVLSQNKKCIGLKTISNNFIKRNKQTMSKIDTDKEVLLKQLKTEAQNPNIQVENSYLAWAYILCSASFLSQELIDQLNYIKKIESLHYATPPREVAKNGETIKDCHNIIAYGSEDLKNFYVDISNAKESSGIVSFNTYSVPDNIRVLNGDGKVLVESGCVGTKRDIIRQVPINNKKHSKIKFEVDALCDKKDSQTGWQIHFSCGSKEKSQSKQEKQNKNECELEAKKMLGLLNSSVDDLILAQETAWMRSLCQKTHYSKIVGEYTHFKTLLSPQSNMSFEKLDMDVSGEFIPPPKMKKLEFANTKNNNIFTTQQRSKKKIDADNNNIDKKLKRVLKKLKSKSPETAKVIKKEKMSQSKREIFELLDQKIPENEDPSLKDVPAVTKHKVTPFVYSYQDFISHKKKYCPSKEKNKESIFNQISSAYCHHAFPRLFGPEDDL